MRRTDHILIVVLGTLVLGSSCVKAQVFKTSAADSSVIIGCDPVSFPPDTLINLRHKDVFATWFVAPIPCYLDTVYWMNGDTIGAADSTGYLIIHQSAVTPSNGPGINY